MKIQYIAVIFIVIILPISIITSSYIHSQIDTIKLQTDYNNRLTSSTYDSIKAFQINTVNNRYSSISNSKIRDIEAAINTFYNSLSNTENIAQEDLKTYVPAIVFTLYDGYYIYSKYDNTYVNIENGEANTKNDGRPVTNKDELNDDRYANYGLKPYIYYSCRYRNQAGTKDFVVNYTLDNAITIYGDLGASNSQYNYDGEYTTLSGYFINPNTIKTNGDNFKVEYYDLTKDDNIKDWEIILKDGDITIKPEILTEYLVFENGIADGINKNYTYLVYNGQKVYRDDYTDDTANNKKYFWYQNYVKTYINDIATISYASKRDWDGNIHSTSALEYYHNACEFSKKITGLIDDISQQDAVTEDGTRIGDLSEEEYKKQGFFVNTQDLPIFKASDTNDPLLSESTFNENRISVIRKSIETNLMVAIANYNIYSGNNYEFAMPILTDEDWSKLADNVSIATFLQGFSIGNKIYNNYCVLTNDSNEEVVEKENIYIVTENDTSRKRISLARM